MKFLTLLFLCGGLLGGCASAPPQGRTADGFNDPFEAQNRKVHAFNKGLDKAILRPSATAYAAVMPQEARALVSNASRNLGLPSVAVNSLLQGDLDGVGLTTSRFLINSTIGLGGLFDPASEFRIPSHDTDFGETLAVWGAPQGAYMELPFFGPTSERAAWGTLVDLMIDPLDYEFDASEKAIRSTAGLLSGLGARAQFTNSIDSVLYDSEDSYAQSRLFYLENRKFQLGTTEESAEDDPYEDPYAQ
jgi:phospholipid-binding lipoprotein MlaA